MHCIYARYSSDRQKETSIADQVAVCSKIAVPIMVHKDEGVSGSIPVSDRPGAARMLADALAGRFQTLLVEGLDRLSRDSVEQESVIRRLEHAGIRIIGVSDGYDSESSGRRLHRGMRGLINEIYLDDLRAKTHRGLSGQVERGLFAGGVPYGYRSIEAEGGRKLQIHPEQSETVLQIFERFASGMGCRKIAFWLNDNNIPSPRGSTWSLTAIYGHRQKGTGILNNDLYRGEYIWNRSQWVKHPVSHKRQRIERPDHEWMRVLVPELQIIPDSLWQAVKERQDRPKVHGGTKGKGGKPPTLLGGLLRCGSCGGPMIAVDKYKYGCGRRKDRGPSACQSNYTVSRKIAEQRIIESVRDELLTPSAIKEMQKAYREIVKQETRPADVSGIKREIDSLVTAITQHGYSEALSARLRAAETRLKEAEREKPLPDIPRLNEYRQIVESLSDALHEDTASAKEALRALLGDITVEHDGTGPVARIESGYTALLANSHLGVVAGAGFCIQMY